MNQSYKLKNHINYSSINEPWLNEIPSHWTLVRTKSILQERITKGFPDEPMLAATQTKGVVRKEDYDNRTVIALKDLHLLKLVKKDDFVISLRSFQGGIEFAREQGIISPAYTVLFSKDHNNQKYLARLFKSKPYIENLTLYVTGIRQGQNIDYEKLSRSVIPLPPLEEQNAIVRFLDYTDRRIKRYIRAKQKLIKLLEEEKQAIIHQAVTRGLNPDVPMKPSGVDWLGEIPENWNAIKIKNIKNPIHNSFVDGPFGSNLKSEHYVENGDVFVIESGFITTGDFVYKKFKTITNSHFETIKRSECVGEDIIIAKIGANYGMAGILPSLDKKSVISGNSLKLTVNEKLVTNKFVQLALLTARKLGALEIMVNSSAQPALTLIGLNNLKLPIPSLDEQNEILQFVDSKTRKLNLLIENYKNEILHFQEYRSRLIADVVTGKLDVRNPAAQLPEELEDVEDVDIEEPEVEDEEELQEEVDP